MTPMKSNSDILFFLDSDDILEKDLLKLMYIKLIENNLDGVSIYKSVKFINNKKNILKEDIFSFQKEIIPFESLFGNGCGLYSTFMIRKKVHYQIGEFPTNHGFDTQHYAFRFLANNKKAMSCEGAIYFHRISEDSNSYYNREQINGKINFNWFQILSEVIFLFNDDAKKFLLDFNIYESSDNLFDSFKKLNPLTYNYKTKVRNDFISYNYRRLSKKENLENHENFWLSLIEKNPEKKLFFTIKSLSNQNKFTINQFIDLTEKYSQINLNELKKTEFTRNTIKNKIIRKLKRL